MDGIVNRGEWNGLAGMGRVPPLFDLACPHTSGGAEREREREKGASPSRCLSWCSCVVASAAKIWSQPDSTRMGPRSRWTVERRYLARWVCRESDNRAALASMRAASRSDPTGASGKGRRTMGIRSGDISVPTLEASEAPFAYPRAPASTPALRFLRPREAVRLGSVRDQPSSQARLPPPKDCFGAWW